MSCFSFSPSLIKFARPQCVVYVVRSQNIHHIFVLFCFLLIRILQYALIENKVLVFHVAFIQCHMLVTIFCFGVFNRH